MVLPSSVIDVIDFLDINCMLTFFHIYLLFSIDRINDKLPQACGFIADSCKISIKVQYWQCAISGQNL